MGWSDTFPILDEVHIDDYRLEASATERRELDGYFRIAKKINRRKSATLVVTSLFWKPQWTEDGAYPPVTREAMKKGIKKKRLKKGESQDLRKTEPWTHYVEPLFKGAAWLRETKPEVTLRVYLAGDMEWLVADLVALGIEVYLMEHSSLVANPGAMWRFLAMEEASARRTVLIGDADRLHLAGIDVERGTTLAKLGLGGWRVPQFGILNERNQLSYRPMLATHFGCAVKLPAAELMKALIWNVRRGAMACTTSAPGLGEREIAGSCFPDYGFDEFFLMTAIYPRLAHKGLLTFVSTMARSPYLAMDIEFAALSNRKSELIWWEPEGCCANPLECEPDVARVVARGRRKAAAKAVAEKNQRKKLAH
jgi:hypothetical protein